MIDTHAHLDFPEFDQDREEVIARAFGNGGKAIVNVGVDLERSKKSIEIAEKFDGVFAAIGFHPDNFNSVEEIPISNFQIPNKSQIPNLKHKNLFSELKSIAKHKKVVAIGECGLDYNRLNNLGKPDFSRGNPVSAGEIKENQKRGFLAQIEIAEELNLPVIVHCREAWDDVFDIISQKSKVKSQNYNLKVESIETKFVLHCYSGGKKDTEKFLKLPNIYFSFSGNITYPKPKERAEKLAEAVQMIPLDKMMLDSDAPFLAPQEFRGKRNEPIFVEYIAKKIAEIKRISEKEVERKTDENAERFFSIGGN